MIRSTAAADLGRQIAEARGFRPASDGVEIGDQVACLKEPRLADAAAGAAADRDAVGPGLHERVVAASFAGVSTPVRQREPIPAKRPHRPRRRRRASRRMWRGRPLGGSVPRAARSSSRLPGDALEAVEVDAVDIRLGVQGGRRSSPPEVHRLARQAEDQIDDDGGGGLGKAVEESDRLAG